MKTVAIIVARMSSTRFPGKVLKELLNKPILIHIVKRVALTKGVDEVVVATSVEENNEPIRKICKEYKIPCYSGSENDVLDRFYNAAKEHNADTVIRITGDCPLADPQLIGKVLEEFNHSKVDFIGVATGAGTANEAFEGGRFPDGLDAEVFSFKILETAQKEASLPRDREHVTPFIWSQPNRFKIGAYKSDKDYSKMRWVVDNEEDFRLIEQIYKELYPIRQDFGLNEILDFFRKNPEKVKINEHFLGAEGYGQFWKKMRTGQELWKKAKRLIPGGSQLLSKRSEMFLPDNWPSYYERAKGVEVYDLDGNKYIDMALMGISSCTLGYADDDVNNAVINVIKKGTQCTLNPPEEVELAELLVDMHPWSRMVRFTRTGGEAVAVAIRIGRAFTKKDKVAFCGYHGWHDWYLASNLADDSNLDGHLLPGLQPNGVPRVLKNTTIPFEYNNIDSLKKLFEEHDIGVIIMEPCRHGGPAENFLEDVRLLATEKGAVLIFDEISSAFKVNVGGVHLLYGINPDIVVYSKMIANGFPMGVVLGNEVMDAAQESFISSTVWTERMGPVAAIATINKMKKYNVPEHLDRIGGLIGAGWEELAKKHNIKLKTFTPNAVITFAFEHPEKMEMKTLFIQEMLKRGFLCSDHVFVSFAHTEEHVEMYLKQADEVFGIIKKALDEGNLINLLEGPVAHTGFKRLVE